MRTPHRLTLVDDGRAMKQAAGAAARPCALRLPVTMSIKTRPTSLRCVN
jgi:hypothetical protein